MDRVEISELKQRLVELEGQVRGLKDERDVLDTLALYGVYADLGLHDRFVDLFTDDCVIEMHGGDHLGAYGDVVVWEGSERVRQFITDPRAHLATQDRAIHIPTLNARVQVEGDDAVADTCSIKIVKEGEEKVIYEAGFSRWWLRRVDGGWRIRKRLRYAIGARGFPLHQGESSGVERGA